MELGFKIVKTNGGDERAIARSNGEPKPIEDFDGPTT
jgi:hypothetical protein